jgi:hypothetical protein
MLGLRMALQAKIWIRLCKQFPVRRSVRVVAHLASLTQGLVLEYEGPGLLPMALSATLISSRHRQSLGTFENVASVRLVALHAIHMAFRHGMMLREMELRLHLQMTFVTGLRVLSRVDDEFAASSPRLNVSAAGSMA